jgi:toxin ParE1/3/4
LEFHPEARDEFIAAATYYNAAVPGLGDRFLLAVRRTTDMILRHPTAGTPRTAKARRVLVSGFPYDVVYQAREDAIEVLAVAHQRRRPGYWRERLPG